MKPLSNRLLIIVSICFLILSCNSCSLFNNKTLDLDLDEVLVGLYNTTQHFPASREDTDAIWVINDQFCGNMGLDPAYHLEWDGYSFQVNYTDVCNDTYETATTIVSISGEVSPNYKTLISFFGTRKLTRESIGGSTDIVEQTIRLTSVPLEPDDTSVHAFITGNVAQYVVSAYWRHTEINGEDTQVSETSNLDFSHPETELNISFNKVYN